MNNVQTWGSLSPGSNLFGKFDGVNWSLSGSMADAGRTLTFHLVGTAQPFGTDTDSDGIPDVTDNCPRVANPSQAQLAVPALTAPPAVTISSCAGSAALALGRPTASDTCGAPPLSITNEAPDVFSLGTTTVTWRAYDGAGNVNTATQVVTVTLGDDPACCPAGSNIILGTSNNDTLTGTSGSDCILGLGGQDTLNGLGGNDYISGGEGNDVIDGGSGADRLYGGNGQDQIRGSIGNDFIDGGGGDDRCWGGDNDDVIRGGQGQDQLFGENGNDQLFGDDGDDRLEGGSGDDLLDGGGLHDTCIGGPGTDTLVMCQTAQQ